MQTFQHFNAPQPGALTTFEHSHSPSPFFLKKWLRDKKNRILTPGDIRHYIKICRALQLTVKYREEIDGLYSQLEKDL
jgi:hypothetical protein